MFPFCLYRHRHYMAQSLGFRPFWASWGGAQSSRTYHACGFWTCRATSWRASHCKVFRLWKSCPLAFWNETTGALFHVFSLGFGDWGSMFETCEGYFCWNFLMLLGTGPMSWKFWIHRCYYVIPWKWMIDCLPCLIVHWQPKQKNQPWHVALVLRRLAYNRIESLEGWPIAPDSQKSSIEPPKSVHHQINIPTSQKPHQKSFSLKEDWKLCPPKTIIPSPAGGQMNFWGRRSTLRCLDLRPAWCGEWGSCRCWSMSKVGLEVWSIYLEIYV